MHFLFWLTDFSLTFPVVLESLSVVFEISSVPELSPLVLHHPLMFLLLDVQITIVVVVQGHLISDRTRVNIDKVFLLTCCNIEQ